METESQDDRDDFHGMRIFGGLTSSDGRLGVGEREGDPRGKLTWNKAISGGRSIK